jgi:hypothetical protein
MRQDAIKAISVWYDSECSDQDAVDGRWIVSDDDVAPDGVADRTDTISSHHTRDEAEAEGRRIAEEREARYIGPDQIGQPIAD